MSFENGIRELETSISFDNIQDQVASFLYATGTVRHSEDILSIEFNDPDPKSQGIVPIKVKFRKREEVSR